MITDYRWFRAGDLNGFFALMFDNVANLVILASILIGAFGFPSQTVLYRMVPGTAIGVLAGDLFYAWMAGRLAKATGRDDVTAMPLGLNAPSIFGMSFGVLGPAYLATHDADLAWKMGMAVTVLVGVFKIALSFAGNAVRRALPRAALLGSIGGAGLALIALLPLLKMYADPIPGRLAFGVILVSLVGGVKIPGKVPGALASALVGIAAFQLLRAVHIVSPLAAPPSGIAAAFHLAFPWPTVAFVGGLSLAWTYLPIILPFSLATVVGGIDNTESAAAAGDVYDTRAILLTEGFCTVLAGLCGGVVESTPYIGHPAYKAMGAGAGYTILTGLFIGLGGIRRLPAILRGMDSGGGDRADSRLHRAGSDFASLLSHAGAARPGGGGVAAPFPRVSDRAGSNRDAGRRRRTRDAADRRRWRNGPHSHPAGQRLHHLGADLGSGHSRSD